MSEVFIYGGLRTPFGRHGGILSGIRPDDLMAKVITHLGQEFGLDDESLEDVIIGNTNQSGEDSRNIGRNSVLIAGLSCSIPGITINRLCGSGLAAVLNAYHCIHAKEGKLFIAGGVESMSRSPWILSRAETAFSRKQRMIDSTLGWRFPNATLTARFGGDSNSETAENIAIDLGISREDSDLFALASQKKYETARTGGFFDDEILSMEVADTDKKGTVKIIQADEQPRPDTSIEKLSALSPLKGGGIVTAGNASGINDGAVALLIGDSEYGIRHDIKPRGRILGSAVCGVEPRLMGMGPVPAVDKVLKRTGLALNQMDVIEINEAFATQVLGCLKQLAIDYEDSRINPNGGAIAIGHPLGASGSRLVLTALRQLERVRGRYALVSMCIGVGQGIAAVIERFE